MPSSSEDLKRVWPYGVVALLLCCFATLSFTAVLGKSATYDEPLHAVGGMVHRYLHDFRINPEDPALFGWWASLPHSADALDLNPNNPFFGDATHDMNQQWFFVTEALYKDGATKADHFLNTSRFMFVLLGVGLGALIAWWAGAMGGIWAMLLAAALFCFDPNFLGHSALVKNDVPLSLLMALMVMSVWRFGRNQGGHWLFLVLAALSCGLALNVKFSAVLFPGIFALLLGIRALLPVPLRVGRLVLEKKIEKLALAAGATIVVFALGWCITWTVYGFRYDATYTGDHMDSASMVKRSVTNRMNAEISRGANRDISQEEFTKQVNDAVAAGNLAMPVKLDLWMQQHHILPEGWLYGFLYTYATTLVRSAYLLGNVKLTGWWYYFPLTMLFKTPTATIAAALLAPTAIILLRRYHRSQAEEEGIEPPPVDDAQRNWMLACLFFPPGIYLAAAMLANLNLGLRHVLPLYPFFFVAVGVAFAHCMQTFPKITRAAGGVLVASLMIATIVAYPNYIAFFNLPSGSSNGGIDKLGDSNLDWGQDLPALVEWQKAHPADQLYLCYFGMANPNAYGLNWVNLPGGYPLLPVSNLSSAPGVIAMSATNVQGIYMGGPLHARYLDILKHEPPQEILNGTIYLFRWPPQ